MEFLGRKKIKWNTIKNKILIGLLLGSILGVVVILGLMAPTGSVSYEFAEEANQRVIQVVKTLRSTSDINILRRRLLDEHKISGTTNSLNAGNIKLLFENLETLKV